MMVLVLEDDFEFILATFHWCQSSTTLLMMIPILIFCPYSCFIDLLWKFMCSSFHLCLIISTLEMAFANISRDVLVLLDVADVHQCSKVDFT